MCVSTRERMLTHSVLILSLPVELPDFNPIEQVWKILKRGASPLIVESAAEYRVLLTELFEKLTNQLSFAVSWIENHLGGYLQRLRYSLLPPPRQC